MLQFTALFTRNFPMPSPEERPLPAGQEEEKLPMPKVMDHIILKQIAHEGQWHMEGGEEIEGLLMEDIVVGKTIRYGAGRHTSTVLALEKGKREGEIIVTTENSTYILKKKGM